MPEMAIIMMDIRCVLNFLEEQGALGEAWVMEWAWGVVEVWG